MRLPENKLDLLVRTSESTGYSRKLVDFVIKDFENSLRFYITNPAVAGKAIKLTNFGTFKFKMHRARKKIARNPLPTKRERIEYIREFLNRFDNEKTNQEQSDNENNNV